MTGVVLLAVIIGVVYFVVVVWLVIEALTAPTIDADPPAMAATLDTAYLFDEALLHTAVDCPACRMRDRIAKQETR